MVALSRRAMLGGVVTAAWSGVFAYLPRGVDAATLDADLQIHDVSYDRGLLCDRVKFTLDNHSDSEVRPVPILWGVGHQTQQSWEVVDGPETVRSGESATWMAAAPRPGGKDTDTVELNWEKQAQLTVVDKGTERRVIEFFVPAEVVDR